MTPPPVPLDAQAPLDPQTADGDLEGGVSSGGIDWVRMAPSWVASTIVHVILLLVMALWFNPIPQKEVVDLTGASTEVTDLEELSTDDIQPLDVAALDSTDMDQAAENVVIAPSESFSETLSNELATNTTVEIDFEGGEFVGPGVLTQTIGQGIGTSLAGIRGGPNKGAAIRKGGGNDASEAAVAAALKWLAGQQMADGGWSFDLRRTPNPCANSGEADKARSGATAMALLPFLGAGHTPKEGKYAAVVRKGLYYLTQRVKPENTRFGPGASWHEPQGTMYSHGMAAIVFCEAYAMTQDKSLQPYAQASVNFIATAQSGDGGWRYDPGQTPGDTSVVGWQIMALKSAHMGYLNVPPTTVKRSYDFLNRVQMDEGAGYGYITRADRPKDGATSAIGLLCRMYLGWKKEHPALQKGVATLSKRGPSLGKDSDMYYNYYATQIMRHWEGEEWEKWNKVMRDSLIETQSKKGAETGSWHFDGNHAAQGGRLYNTSLATMILEVYYRHLPLFQKTSTEAEFVP
jgi:hypothetical protein